MYICKGRVLISHFDVKSLYFCLEPIIHDKESVSTYCLNSKSP